MASPRILTKEDRIRAKQLSERSDALGLRQFAGHILFIAIGAAGITFAKHWAVMLLAQVWTGIGMTFLFAPAHETVHRTAFRSRWMNDAVGNIAGLTLILPPIYFRHFHLAHHRHTQIPGKDPELAGKDIQSKTGLGWHLSGLPYWKSAVVGLLHRMVGKTEQDFIDDSNRVAIVREARLYFFTYATAFIGSILAESTLMLTYWVIPMLLTQPFLRLYLLAEHKLCTLDNDPFSNTRTMLTNPLVRFLAWNMPYHTEHHAFMAVPFHALPDLHTQIRERIKVMTPGYAAFYRDYLKSLA